MKRREAIKMAGMVLGYSVSGYSIQGLIQGCKPRVILNWIPQFLSQAEANIINDIAEIIIPETDSPGAKSVGVPAFIDEMLHLYASDEDKKEFNEGLEKLEINCKEKLGKSFNDLQFDDKTDFVNELHEESLSKFKRFQKLPFLLKVKELTILGYYTSEYGAMKALQYLPVPGRYSGCVPLADIGKAWAT